LSGNAISPNHPESDARLRAILLQRYSRVGVTSFQQRLRFYVKWLVWRGVIGGAYVFKRLFDIVASTCLLTLLMPFFLLLALLIRLDSPGPVLFRQTRVGRWGRLFTMWKFRSMYIDAEVRKAGLIVDNEMAGGVLFKMKHDPRITRVGRFIRKASIDELPQLWNVLRGDMSLVGPRPAVPSEVDEYSLDDRRRLEVIPGITCIWQVSGRSDIPFEDQVQLDIQYIESQSFWQDVLILLKTVPAVLFGRGAY
jgi:exopolysaccharide biosynthesis polyprenyl glycosylphosphotransferase